MTNNENTVKMATLSFSFKKGWKSVSIGDSRSVRNEIMVALGISTRAAWLNRLNGKVEPKISEAEAIASVFQKYGITDFWGEE